MGLQHGKGRGGRRVPQYHLINAQQYPHRLKKIEKENSKKNETENPKKNETEKPKKIEKKVDKSTKDEFDEL